MIFNHNSYEIISTNPNLIFNNKLKLKFIYYFLIFFLTRLIFNSYIQSLKMLINETIQA